MSKKEICHKCKKYPAEYNQTECEFCMGISSKDEYIQELQQENKQLKEQLEFERQCQNRFFKINNKTYDGRIILSLLKQRDEVIDEAIKYVQDNMSYTEIRKWIDIGKFEIVNEDILDNKMINELLEILQKYKGDSK